MAGVTLTTGQVLADMMPECECGCGERVRSIDFDTGRLARWRAGHRYRVPEERMNLLMTATAPVAEKRGMSLVEFWRMRWRWFRSEASAEHIAELYGFSVTTVKKVRSKFPEWIDLFGEEFWEKETS